MIVKEQELTRLEILLERMQLLQDLEEKISFLIKDPILSAYFEKEPKLFEEILKLGLPSAYLLFCVAALGQAPVVFQKKTSLDSLADQLLDLVKILEKIESLYFEIGGIIGYQLAVLNCLSKEQKPLEEVSFQSPVGIDFSKDLNKFHQAVYLGIEHTKEIAEVYPIGGAGERLGLMCEETKEPLPVAELTFMGRSLFEGLIRDLQAREYLHYRLTGEQVMTPILLMTSLEKHNHAKILTILKKQRWFGREEGSFTLMIQPQVPVVTEEGRWAVLSPFQPILKPGGHGVIWKLAEDCGAFEKLKKQGVKKLLVRQINNPIAATDGNLLALAGVGFEGNKTFGFISCPRLLNTAEGVNVLKEKKEGTNFSYTISNIEYLDFPKWGLSDHPLHPGGIYSAFPANTNVLLADIEGIQKALLTCPFPGQLVNLKSEIQCLNAQGEKEKRRGGRLETTMQNIADVIVDRLPQKLEEEKQDSLQTFIVFNSRKKTISVTKKMFKGDVTLEETPEGCFYDVLNNAKEMLETFCHMKMPKLPSKEEYQQQGPSFFVFFHPAIGPLFEIIGQKISGGEMTFGSLLQLEIAELWMKDCVIEGSLQIFAKQIMGEQESKGILKFSPNCGKCYLNRVKIKNKGIDRNASTPFWKGSYHHLETLEIILEGNAQFYAEDVVFCSGHKIVVPDGFLARAVSCEEGFEIHLQPIQKGTFFYQYLWGEDKRVVLKQL